MQPLILLVLFLASLPSPARATTIIYSTLINTSSFAGTPGSRDFNFESGPFGSQPATVQIRRFDGDGVPAGSPTLAGDARAVLPGDLTLDNGAGFNDYFQGFTFGSTLSFDNALGGPALESPTESRSGSTYAFSMFSNAYGTTPALTSNTVDGYAIMVNINADGSTMLRSDTDPATSVTPEVPSGILVATATIFAYGFRSRWILARRNTSLWRVHSIGVLRR